jgi:uncharacterized phage protein gp47/JayE
MSNQCGNDIHEEKWAKEQKGFGKCWENVEECGRKSISVKKNSTPALRHSPSRYSYIK